MTNILGVILIGVTFGFPAFALESQCFPDTPEAKDWPVCVIYLHGLHPSSDTGSYTKYEAQNRPILARFSETYLKKKHCRLAAPVAQKTTYSKKVGQNVRNWQHANLSTVEKAARMACGGPSVKLMKGRTLVGFSAGGYEAMDLAKSEKCTNLRDYTTLIGIGLPEIGTSIHNNTVAGACPNLKLYTAHNFAGQFSPPMQRSIAATIPDLHTPTQIATDVAPEPVPAGQTPASR